MPFHIFTCSAFSKEFRVSKNKAKKYKTFMFVFFWHISVFNHTFVQFTLILDIILLKVFQQSTNHSVKSLLYCHSCLVVSSFHFVVFLYHHLVIQTLVIISCHPLECTVRITYYLVKGRRGWVSRTEMKTFSLPTAFHSSSTHSIAGMA